jgi:hypothetical protein
VWNSTLQIQKGRAEARPREFKTDNAQLKARIRILSKRLADLGQDPNIAA